VSNKKPRTQGWERGEKRGETFQSDDHILKKKREKRGERALFCVARLAGSKIAGRPTIRSKGNRKREREEKGTKPP